jgi:hypothetical protein
MRGPLCEQYRRPLDSVDDREEYGSRRQFLVADAVFKHKVSPGRRRVQDQPYPVQIDGTAAGCWRSKHRLS